MTTTTETPRELAEREAEAAKQKFNDWAQRGAQIRGHADTLSGELGRVKEELRNARLAAVSGGGNDCQVAALADRERAITAAVAETSERLAAVADQIQLARDVWAAAQERLDPIVRAEERTRVVGLANLADRRIEAALNQLHQALADRYQFEGVTSFSWNGIHLNQVRHPYHLEF
jgi:hypothetical protein